MRQAFSEAVSEDDLVALAQTIKRKALEGDMAAAKLLLAYAIGKPGNVVAPDTLDLQEIRQYEDEVRHYSSLPSVAATPDLGLACTIARTSRPGIADVAARDLGKALVEGEFPEGSPFEPPEDLMCEDLPGRDTEPSAIGDNGAPGAVAGEEVPALEEGGVDRELLEALAAASKGATEGESHRRKLNAGIVALAAALLQEALGPGDGMERASGQGTGGPPPSPNRSNGGAPT
jgi:hypothetical protein